jgi:hypothetical protein
MKKKQRIVMDFSERIVHPKLGCQDRAKIRGGDPVRIWRRIWRGVGLPLFVAPDDGSALSR